MTLINARGKPIRSEVTARARAIKAQLNIPWREALLAAYAEAREETQDEAATARRCRSLALAADRLMEPRP